MSLRSVCWFSKTRSVEGESLQLGSWSETVGILAGLPFLCLAFKAAVSSCSGADQFQTRYQTPRQKKRVSLTSSAYDRLVVLNGQASCDAS